MVPVATPSIPLVDFETPEPHSSGVGWQGQHAGLLPAIKAAFILWRATEKKKKRNLNFSCFQM
jgi:hypothetical protein